jgi:VWFA-related protein
MTPRQDTASAPGAVALRAFSATLLLVALLAGDGSARAQAPPAPEAQEPPTFGREVELVRIDVVVTDKDGNPVQGLTRDAFQLLDEGKPQTLETFEEVERPLPPASTAPTPRPRLASNAPPPPEGDTSRTVVILFDDLNLTMETAPRAKAAVALFLDQGVRPGDRVTLIATGGGVWWATRMPEGREDLLAILKGLTGRRVKTDVRDAITDFEAMRIYVYNDTMVQDQVRRRFETFGVTSHAESEGERMDRETYQPGIVDPYVMRRATEEYLKARTRNRATLAALERALRPLAATRERKTVVLASDGFVYDMQEEAFARVTEAARRANAVIHFLDARGLVAPSLYSAQFDAPPDVSTVGAVLADSSLDAEGAETLARDTGGYAVHNTNDLTDGVERIAVESRNYYLLGFSPDVPRDGRFRKVQVKVRGKGLNVRARRGYYAPGGAPAAPRKADRGKDLAFQEALDSAAYAPDLPLRMTAYVLGEQDKDRARTLVAVDVDVNEVSFEEQEGQLRGALDVLLVVAQRETGEFFRYDQRVDLARKPGNGATSWYTLLREFELKPGGYQAKIVVRDPRTQKLGSVAYVFDVPALDGLRVGTPVLTDLLQETAEGIGPVVVARRTFAAGRPLYCRFDVFGARKDEHGAPRVLASHVLRRSDGTVMGRSEPTPILPTSLGAVARLVQIPLNVSPGDYELVLDVRDDVAGKQAEVVEPFTAR